MDERKQLDKRLVIAPSKDRLAPDGASLSSDLSSSATYFYSHQARSSLALHLKPVDLELVEANS